MNETGEYNRFYLRDMITPADVNGDKQWLLETPKDIRAGAVFEASKNIKAAFTNLKNKNMPSLLKNIIAVILGVIVGSVVNMSLITISGSIIPLPEGVDNTTMEGLKETMHLFEPKHFIFPFCDAEYGRKYCTSSHTSLHT